MGNTESVTDNQDLKVGTCLTAKDIKMMKDYITSRNLEKKELEQSVRNYRQQVDALTTALQKKDLDVQKWMNEAISRTEEVNNVLADMELLETNQLNLLEESVSKKREILILKGALWECVDNPVFQHMKDVGGKKLVFDLMGIDLSEYTQKPYSVSFSKYEKKIENRASRK